MHFENYLVWLGWLLLLEADDTSMMQNWMILPLTWVDSAGYKVISNWPLGYILQMTSKTMNPLQKTYFLFLPKMFLVSEHTTVPLKGHGLLSQEQGTGTRHTLEMAHRTLALVMRSSRPRLTVCIVADCCDYEAILTFDDDSGDWTTFELKLNDKGAGPSGLKCCPRLPIEAVG